MGLQEAYAKMAGPQVYTTTVQEKGSLGQGINQAINTVVPYYMMAEMMKKGKTRQNDVLTNLFEMLKKFLELDKAKAQGTPGIGQSSLPFMAGSAGMGDYTDPNMTPNDVRQMFMG